MIPAPNVFAQFCKSMTVATILMLIALLSITAPAQNYPADITGTANWMAQNVTQSDGAVVKSEYDNPLEIIPYFSSLGVEGFVEDSAYYTNIKNWMEWYWNHISKPMYFDLNPQGQPACATTKTTTSVNGAIEDFQIINGVETGQCDNLHPDSTDSYAATYLSLAWTYWSTKNANAQAYISSIAKGPVDRLDTIAQVALATYQSNNLTNAKPLYNIEFLEDNSEVYRGLADVVSLYKALGMTSQVTKYQNYPTAIKKAITTTLWDSTNKLFYTYTSNGGQPSSVVWSSWYGPNGSVSEIFPIALGVVLPSSSYAQAVWPAFQSHWQSQWTTLKADAFPWVIVGYAAALMGDKTDANAFIQEIEKQFVNDKPPFRGCGQSPCKSWSVNEAGYFMRLCAYMETH